VRMVPVVLSALLMAAHFSRAGNTGMVAVSLAFPALLLIRRPWAARGVQVGLLLGAIEWFWTLSTLARQRIASGEPWLRLALILGTVALLTAASALVFRSEKLRRRYRLGD
jgi:hypothetical protein